ncbi:LPS-assembly protein LptD [Treponema primitia]|uniref:LPS-assembly protein LptD n=1 Tax=Treponema primitia TaxID=88058 RepID=UPI000255534C|nr:LPS-assembly protein LptD [Treponema primitia]
MSILFRRLSCTALLAFLLVPAVLPELSAQEAAAPEASALGDEAEETAPDETAAAVPESTVRVLTRDEEILELDIKTSTLSELAAWSRSLGLSEGGDRTALGNRLREYFKLDQVFPVVGGVEIEIGDGPKPPKIITIESARSTEYFTLDAVDEDYARLRGDVVISLKDGDSVHRIRAWELLYNRSRNLLSANGGVEYIKESGDTIETFRGESITVDLDNWSSIFMDGVSERSLSGDTTTYRFAGNIISRSDEEATVLAQAEISNASNPEALWSLKASKLWLLPGSDFAILNGFLKVGEIPVLYIPFFFFPADEIIFHPVLGYRSREGSFIQTTTYILGRPKASATSESSISKILGNSTDMEKTQHGIFLKSTGKKSRDPNTTRLSLLADAYANLGAYLGTELALPKKGIFNEYNFSLGFGFTRDVQLIEGNSIYTPFPDYDGVDHWNSSRVGGLDVPFRYRMTNDGALSGKYGAFSWSLPHYSDPYVNRDFLDRTEEMDYIAMLKQGGNIVDAEDALTKNVLGSYEWRLSGSSTLSLPILSPYITSITLSSLTSFVSFNYRTSQALANSLSPNKTFFYPDKFTIYSVSASISGTPLSLGSSQSSTRQSGTNTGAAAESEPEPEPDPFNGLGALRSPWETDEKKTTNSEKTNSMTLSPPTLSQRFDLPKSGGLNFSLAYQLSPTSASELKFRSDSINWKESEDIDWNEMSSILTSVRTDGSITFSLADVNNIVSNSLRFSGSGSWQEYSYINEEAEEYSSLSETERLPDQAKINAAKVRAMGQTSFTTSAEYITTIRPFYLSPIWSNTNLQYSVKGLIAKSELKTPVPDPIPPATSSSSPDPKDAYWDIIYGDWDKESLDSHRVAANIQALVMNKAQNLSVTAELPPEDTALTGDATMRVWLSETNFNGKIIDPYEDPIYDPLRLTETLTFTNAFKVSQNVVYEPEKDEFTSMSSTLFFYGFSASFTANYSTTYNLISSGSPGSEQWVWTQSADSSFQPREFKLGYNQTFKKDELWRKRLSFALTLNTGLTFDLQRFTNSSLNFGLSFTLGISKFIDITLGTTSGNGVIFRYFRDFPIFDVPDGLPMVGETNIFTDFVNSFRFDDDELRRSSGFKLKSFKLSLLHHLGDWNAKLDMTLSPYLPTGEREYNFNTEISFIVQWLPISEIKSEIIHNKDKFEFK